MFATGANSFMRSYEATFIAALSGPIDEPSPITSSVTPSRISLCERPSCSNEVCDWLSMLMKPGATARPVALISLAAWAAPRVPTAATRSPLIATSPTNGLPPLPS